MDHLLTVAGYFLTALITWKLKPIVKDGLLLNEFSELKKEIERQKQARKEAESRLVLFVLQIKNLEESQRRMQSEMDKLKDALTDKIING